MSTYNNRPLFPIVADCIRLLEKANKASNLGPLSYSMARKKFDAAYEVMSRVGREQFDRQIEFMKGVAK